MITFLTKGVTEPWHTIPQAPQIAQNIDRQRLPSLLGKKCRESGKKLNRNRIHSWPNARSLRAKRLT
jgi:hypothetical protein